MDYRLGLSVTVLTLAVTALGLVTALAGLFAKDLYVGNSVSMIAQGRGQDAVTLFIAVPVTIVVFIFAARGSVKAQLALAGMLGYFLYTYASYVFAWKFNNLFLAYVAAFSGSLFGFIIIMVRLYSIATESSAPRPPLVAGSVLLFLVAAALLFMWLSQIAQAMQGESVPILADNDARPVIQGLDLGIIVPTALLIGILLLQGSQIALVWLPVLLVKGLTMGLAIVTMTIFMARAGTPDTMGAIIFAVLTLLFTGVLIWVFVSMRVGETVAG
jgi:hypothetical protein